MVLEILKTYKPRHWGLSLPMTAEANAKYILAVANTTARLLSRKREKRMTGHQMMKEFVHLCQ